MMHARAGERVRVVSHTVGAAERWGTVLETKSSGGLVVRWDDGQESMVFPGSDMRVEDDEDDQDDEGSTPPSEEIRGGHVDMRLTETDDHCEAVATLMTRRGSFQATGLSRRNPTDAHVPLIGEELAIARALQSLGDQLETEARDAIDRHEHSAGHLI